MYFPWRVWILYFCRFKKQQKKNLESQMERAEFLETLPASCEKARDNGFPTLLKYIDNARRHVFTSKDQRITNCSSTCYRFYDQWKAMWTSKGYPLTWDPETGNWKDKETRLSDWELPSIHRGLEFKGDLIKHSGRFYEVRFVIFFLTRNELICIEFLVDPKETFKGKIVAHK